MALIRLNKYLASHGVASRRKADELIAAGKVSVDGKVVTEMGVYVDDTTSTVSVDGQLVVKAVPAYSYYVVYKPRGYVSTTTRRFGEDTVVSLVPTSERLFIVGRLDKDSEGLVILTNDGEYAYRITHPKYEVVKTYHVLVHGTVTESVISQLERGVVLDDGTTAPCTIRVINPRVSPGDSLLEFSLIEGKKREIRRMCATVHLFVKQLVRVSIGDVMLGSLKPGEYRQFSISSRS